MYFKYGTYQHENNEVDLFNVHEERMYSPRNRIMFFRRTFQIRGHICQSTEATIKTYINALRDAYHYDFGDAVLYHSDGTRSSHYMLNSETINGVRVKVVSFPEGGPGEYASGRYYAITLECDQFQLNNTQPVDQIYSFEESIVTLGNGGPDWELITLPSGWPVAQINAEITPQRVIQSGEVVGMQGWPLVVPTPVYASLYEHGNLRMVEYGSPRKIGVNYRLMYPLKYRYIFSLIDSQPAKVAAQDYTL